MNIICPLDNKSGDLKRLDLELDLDVHQVMHRITMHRITMISEEARPRARFRCPPSNAQDNNDIRRG